MYLLGNEGLEGARLDEDAFAGHISDHPVQDLSSERPQHQRLELHLENNLPTSVLDLPIRNILWLEPMVFVA